MLSATWHPMRVLQSSAGRANVWLNLAYQGVSGWGCPEGRDRAILIGREDVSNAAHGLDDLRLCRVKFDLLAQSGDPDIDASVKRIPVAVMGHFQKLIPIQNASGMISENLQQIELHRGDCDFFAIGRKQFVLFNIQQAIAELHGTF